MVSEIIPVISSDQYADRKIIRHPTHPDCLQAEFTSVKQQNIM